MGCPAITFQAQSVGSDFTSRAYDYSDGTLYMSKDTEALSWGTNVEVAVETSTFGPDDLIPTLTYDGLTYRLQPMAYLYDVMVTSDVFFPHLLCVFLLEPYLSLLPSHLDSWNDVEIQCNLEFPGRTGEGSTYLVSEFTRIVQVDPSPKRNGQAIWLARPADAAQSRPGRLRPDHLGKQRESQSRVSEARVRDPYDVFHRRGCLENPGHR